MNAAGQAQDFTLGNGVETIQTYNPADRPLV
jgi:hypothetical protein